MWNGWRSGSSCRANDSWNRATSEHWIVTQPLENERPFSAVTRQFTDLAAKIFEEMVYRVVQDLYSNWEESVCWRDVVIIIFLMPKVLHSQGTWKLAKCSDCVWNSYDGDSEIVSELARHTALKRWIATEILWYRKAVSCGSAVQRITLLPISVRKCWASSARGPSVLLLLIRPTTTLHLKRRLWKVCNKWPHTTDTVRIRYMHESRTKKCTKIT